MNITVNFEWTVEEIADIARSMFGAEEYAWVNNWTDADIEDFSARLKSAIGYQLSKNVEQMLRRYVEEEFPKEDDNA